MLADGACAKNAPINNADMKGASKMSEPIIKLGSKGEAVKHAQQALISRGYTPLDDDGIFGPITRNRVSWYPLNRSVGEYWASSSPLDVDGIVGRQTWSALGS